MQELRLLIVDDELGIREGAKRALRNFKLDLSYIEEEFNLNIETAESGEEAIEKLNEGGYDIVLLDNKLPGIHGTEVLEYMSKNEISCLTIMITAFASIETAVEATKNGAYDFLTKPFTPQELRGAVQKAAKHRVLHDITRKLTEDKKKVRFEFISILSHELKAPIAAVTNYLKLMQKRMMGENIADYDKFVDRSIGRMDGMQKLIFDLLDLTRLESGEKQRELQEINVSAVAKNCLDHFVEMAEEKGVVVQASIPENMHMKADQMELEMIFNNLISNGIKYNKDNGVLDFSIIDKDDGIVIRSKDSGIGIAKEDLDKLFKEFSRIKNEKTANISGSGIGLSTVKKIIKLYKGETKVESEYGKGTTFNITLKKL